MNFIGIDPGVKGGIAFIDNFFPIVLRDGRTITEQIRVIEMPLTTNHLDVNKVWSSLPADFSNSFCMIEQILTMPYQSVKATASTAINYGKLLAVLELAGVPYQIIHPGKWKKEFQLIGKTKYASAEVASRLFPGQTFVTARGRLMDGAAEALLLAEYARRKYKG